MAECTECDGTGEKQFASPEEYASGNADCTWCDGTGEDPDAEEEDED